MLKPLKENLSLLALLVLLTGTSSTDAYYGSFGLRYEFLNISASHILFRGLSAIWAFPPLAILYLISLLAVSMQSRIALGLGGLDRLRMANHAAVAAFVLLAWFGGTYAGASAARTDMSMEASTLPRISKIVPKLSGDPLPSSPNEGYRLLMQNVEGIRIFKAVSNPKTESPIVRFIAGGSIDAINLCARC